MLSPNFNFFSRPEKSGKNPGRMAEEYWGKYIALFRLLVAGAGLLFCFRGDLWWFLVLFNHDSRARYKNAEI